MSKVLNLSLLPVWYNAIDRGTKKIEYRDFKDYWLNKLLEMRFYKGKTMDDIRKGLAQGTLELHPVNWTHVRFHCQEREMEYEIKEIKVYKGHEMFAIHLGKRTSPE